jgi:sodium-dependent phosphate transporter
MGPFMAIYAAYTSGEIVSKPNLGNDSYWILALGGTGIGLGLLLYGYKIIEAIGVKLAVVTPSRGFAIELGAAIVIIIGSYIGLPLSTTHCQVGATTGVALLEGSKGVNKFVLGKTAVGWILTLIIAGIGAGILVAQGVHAPLAGSISSPNSPQAIFLERVCPKYITMQDPGNFTVVNDTLVCL